MSLIMFILRLSGDTPAMEIPCVKILIMEGLGTDPPFPSPQPNLHEIQT